MAKPFQRINAFALQNIDKVLDKWCPDGKRRGREYLPINPKRLDSKAGSFSINLDSGAWADFATGDKGGDVISLIAYLDGLKQGKAADRLAEYLGYTSSKDNSNSCERVPKRTKGDWSSVAPVPSDAPAPPRVHPTHGRPSHSWEYRNEAGELLCIIFRYEPGRNSDRKQYFPLTYCKSAIGEHKWCFIGLPDPRPLYNLGQLKTRSNDVVIVCEGEKAADAAAVLYPSAVVTTMMNGAQGIKKSDWSPLAGRDVWLWPDNDSVGKTCMLQVAQILKTIKAAEVKIINIEIFPHMQPKDDAADLIDRGWTTEDFQKIIDEKDFLITPKLDVDDELPESKTKFHLNDEGIWYFGQNENGREAPPLWICSRLEITAVTRDAKSQAWGRLLEFDDLDGTRHSWAMPMEMLAGSGDGYRAILLAMGLQMSTSSKARNLLTQYIQTSKVDTRARCVERTGWHGSIFVMPDRSIGHAEERILFQSTNAASNAFKTNGALNDWKANVSLACRGNSRLVFAVSAAFAAPLLDITGMESGGFHYRGDSSTGKTTALRVAASVWGGSDYLQRWRATDNGLEALAAQHSDCLLVLDELSQVDPKSAGEVAYMLANGSGKVRSGRTGSMREIASWRLLFLSSGEAGLAEHMALANRKPKAGQEIRLVDIPADAGTGHGLFETLPSNMSGASFSKLLTSAATKYYGVAANAFLKVLVDNLHGLPAKIKTAQSIFTAKNLKGESGGQANRAALRFALVGAAGELATAWGITGWDSGEAIGAAETCFKAWLLQRGGAANQEQSAMVSQVRRFFELHGESRFSDWDRPVSDSSQHAPKTINRAGYRRHTDVKDAEGKPIYTDESYPEGDEKKAKETHYYVFPETFKTEVCSGFDYRSVCKVLISSGALITEGRGFTRKERLPGGEGSMHVFRITPQLWSAEE